MLPLTRFFLISKRLFFIFDKSIPVRIHPSFFLDTPLTQSPEHEPEYFAAVVSLASASFDTSYTHAQTNNVSKENISSEDLVNFSSENVESVRVATSAYGIHLFGKLRIPAASESDPAYIHFRIFIAGGDEPPKLHSIHTEEKDDDDGGKTYRAIFTKDDELEWFDT